MRQSGRFPLTAVRDVNYYALFAKHGCALLGPCGRMGRVLPTGIATDDGTKRFFQAMANAGALATLFDCFENRERLFPAVDSRQKFCLLTLARAPVARGEFAFS